MQHKISGLCSSSEAVAVINCLFFQKDILYIYMYICMALCIACIYVFMCVHVCAYVCVKFSENKQNAEQYALCASIYIWKI